MKLEGFCAAKNGKLLEPILDYIASTEELAWEALYLNDYMLREEGLCTYYPEEFKEVVQAFGYEVVPCVLTIEEQQR